MTIKASPTACTSITQTGKPCKNTAKYGDTWCTRHIATNACMGVRRRK